MTLNKLMRVSFIIFQNFLTCVIFTSPEKANEINRLKRLISLKGKEEIYANCTGVGTGFPGCAAGRVGRSQRTGRSDTGAVARASGCRSRRRAGDSGRLPRS